MENLFMRFVQTLTPDQLANFTALAAQSAAAAGAVNASSELPLSAPPRVAAARRARSTMTKKPVNSFMTFRKYYSPVFTGATQKSKSGFVSMIWEAEPKRGIWALLGEAYSDMRDHHEEAIPMDKFLSLAVPLLPVIPADSYLVKMGWQLTKNSAGEVELSRKPNFNVELAAAEYPSRTNLSAKDITDHCYRLGLANKAHRRRKPTLRELAARERMNNSPTAGQTPPPACGGTLTLAVAPQTVDHAVNAAASTESPGLLTGSESPDAIANTESTSLNDSESSSISSNDYLTIEAVTADQQQAFARVPEALHFHPNISPPILGFDPRIIQDDFDPFDLDLSHFIDFDA